MAFQITPEYIKALRQHLEDKNFSGLESLLLDLHAADVAEIAQSLDADQAFALMQTLGSERFSDVIVYFDEERRGEILENFTGKEIVPLSVTFIRQCRVVLQNMNEALSALRHGKAESWHQLFTDGTSRRQIAFQNLVIAVMED